MWRDPHEQEVTAAVSLDAPWALVQRLNGLVRDSGSKAERRGVDYIIKQLAKAGVPHALHEPELLISLPRRARLEVVAPEPRVLTAKTPSMSLSTDGRYKRGNLVYVPTGQAGAITAIFARVELAADVAGRVVLTEGYPSPGKVAALQDRGAQAAVFISPGERIHEGICTTIWGSPDLDSIGRKPTIPVLAVNKAEGAWLRALAEAGAVKVRYATKLDEGWRPIPVLVAEIRGTVEPEKFVLLHGHIDSWHQGIGDNATGDATLLEVARVLVQHRQHLRRSVRIAWWSGHSHGRYAGSTWFADTFATDIDENCILHINCDSPGCRWAAVFERTLRAYQEAAGSGFSLGETIEDAQALGQDLARFYDRTAALTDAAVDDPRVRRANDVQRRLARILVPVNYTRAGRFRHDAAVDVPPLPDLEPAAKLASLDPGSEAYRVTLIHLTRGRNRVRVALRAARQVLADAGG